jgi:phosphinothricin acetyltransferase
MTTPPLALRVRPAVAADLDGVGEIYADLVLTSHVSFELVPPERQAWLDRLQALDERDAFLVAEIDGAPGPMVAGFAYSAPFRPKPAYAGSRETTIHLAGGHAAAGSVRFCTASSSPGWLPPATG